MPAIQAWLQSVLATKDFIHLMFSLMFFTSQLHLKSKMHLVSCKFMSLMSAFGYACLIIILYFSQLLHYLCFAGHLIMLPDS
jgi:hypothetical protein